MFTQEELANLDNDIDALIADEGIMAAVDVTENANCGNDGEYEDKLAFSQEWAKYDGQSTEEMFAQV